MIQKKNYREVNNDINKKKRFFINEDSLNELIL